MDYSILLDPIHDAQALVGYAQQIESLGFSSIWYPDEKYYRECYIGLTLMASATSNIQLGPCVTEPYLRPPILTAASIATLSEVAPGRVWLGMGAGGRGLANVNIKRKKPAKAIREAIEVIRRLLKGEIVDYQGEIISLHERGLDFSPNAVVPIMIGTGHGNLIKELGGEIADAVMVANVTIKQSIMSSLEQIEKGAKKSARSLEDIHLISRLDVAIHEDRELAKKAISPKVLSAIRASYPNLQYLDHFPEMVFSSKLLRVLNKKDYLSKEYYSDPDRATQLIGAELAGCLSLYGTREEVKAKLQQIIDLGHFNEIALRPVPSEGQTMEDLISAIAATISG